MLPVNRKSITQWNVWDLLNPNVGFIRQINHFQWFDLLFRDFQVEIAQDMHFGIPFLVVISRICQQALKVRTPVAVCKHCLSIRYVVPSCQKLFMGGFTKRNVNMWRDPGNVNLISVSLPQCSCKSLPKVLVISIIKLGVILQQLQSFAVALQRQHKRWSWRQYVHLSAQWQFIDPWQKISTFLSLGSKPGAAKPVSVGVR